ncbi:50S ribosomal protein L23 [Hondaea fermentalgiana]|uniref:Large ribosomal subunit protein uL23m n=1 Tax=Hondaea fermentalgiana TaxID=2315210 RepID=A0A2R5GW68_9STRA|nr:50S ribosomal protein L23 [Hondaea fermentalgiana]|eukprot:GBG32913.1 50S ribosomal protein L23 [Hondaea fermentalgiana]
MVNNPLKETNLDRYTFRVPPQMNKFQISDYLEAVYDLRVKKVHTVNYDGKVKRRNGLPFKQKAYKKAVVYLHTEADDITPAGGQDQGSSSSSSSSA